MKKTSLSIFELGSLIWISTAIVATLLALLGIFYVSIIVAWFIGAIVFCGFQIKNKKIELAALEKWEKISLVAIAALGLLLSVYTTPTIFGGRDEGSFSNAAILLAQNHSLSHSSTVTQEFFEVYGPGKALNFPGFFYSATGALKSQFLPAYTSWVGVHYGLFGLTGLKFANFLPLLTFLFSFYLVVKKYAPKKSFRFASLGILALSLPIIVFYKFTLTEIFFASLLWFALHLLIRYFDDRTYQNFLLMTIPLLLTPFVRIESLGIILALILIIILSNFANARQARFQLLLVVLGAAIALSFLANARFFVDTFRNFFTIALPSLQPGSGLGSFSLLPDDWENLYMLRILYGYNILHLIILGTATIIVLLKKKLWRVLLPFFFLSPTLIYLIDANISLDHPWMLRRFLFAIIPMFLLYAILLLESVAFKFPKFIWSMVAIFLVVQVIHSSQFVFASQNKNLLEQTNKLSQSFSDGDLVLVSRLSSGSGWSLMSEPLRNVLGKQAVYFFNPNDFEKIDIAKFENIYLLTSNKELDLYQNLPKQKVDDYLITNNIIEPSRKPNSFPSMIEYQVEGSIYKLSKD